MKQPLLVLYRHCIRMACTLIILLYCTASAHAQMVPNANFSTSNIGSGWDEPVGTAFNKTGTKLFVWEKSGKVWLLNRNTTTGAYTKQATAVLDISPEVGNWRDHGMLGFALDPNFDANGLFYVMYVVDRHYLMYYGTSSYNAATNDYYKATIGRITRYKAITSGSNVVADGTSRTILLGETKSTGIPILHESHGIGSLVFAADGTLLASAGDAASYNTNDVGSLSETYYAQALTDGIIKTNENVGAFRAQMITSLDGKILRIDPTNGNGVSSNPFYQSATPRSARSRVWALGFRNPFRFCVRPNTGSNNPATGDIGEIYVGDVGWNTYEELNVIKTAGTNCGWPLFEGIGWQDSYAAMAPQNKDEPNPLYGIGGCTKQYFTFKDLIKQATYNNNTTVYNPCNAGTAISSGNANRFVNRMPVIDWKHYVDSARIPVFSGSTLKITQIGSAASTGTGTPFQGNAAVGGCWYDGNMFPAEYKNTYFMADYGGAWIKRVTMLYVDEVQKVDNFSNSGFGAVVQMSQNPADGSLFCADIGANTIVRIAYGGNQPPVVKMQASKIYGVSPLSVTFNSTGSVDPEAGPITYSWNFGDGTALVTTANPTHTFTATAGVPKKFVVTLTVKDNQNQTSTDSIIISANNTPPVVSITSPVKNSTYKLGTDTAYTLKATVTDAEQANGNLKYLWQVALRHNNHEHPEPIDTTRLTSAVISRIGCNGDTYYWFVKLTVTDAAGLSTVDSSRIYPFCGVTLPVTLSSIKVAAQGSSNIINWVTGSEINLLAFEIERSYDGINFERIGRVNAQRAAGAGYYSWADADHAPGYVYYRLKMIDFSEYYTYSDIVKSYTAATGGNTIFVKPNPFNNEFTLTANFATAGTVLIRLINEQGAVIKTFSTTVTPGFNSFKANGLEVAAPGIYIAEIIQGQQKRRLKLIKAN